MKKVVILLFLILLLGITFSEDFYPTTIAGLQTEVRLHGFGTISDLKDGEEVNFQTITFPDSSFQKIKVLKEVLTINGKTIYPTYSLDEFENKNVNFTIPYNGEFTYELIAKIETQSLIYEMNDYNLGQVDPTVVEFLKRSEKIESDSTQILTLTKNKLHSNSFFESLTETIFWVNDYVEYAQGSEFNQYYLLQKSAVDTLIEKKGVCDEFSNLAAAMLRAKGIPTRLAIGITFDGHEWGNHAWLEVYHNEFGWIPSDPTFREPGFVDATHIRLGSFRDVSLSVATASYPSTASIIFQTQTRPEVKVIDKNYFLHVGITPNTKELFVNQWNKVSVNVKNLTNIALIVPIKVSSTTRPNGLFLLGCVKDSNSCIFLAKNKKSIQLTPGEEKEVTFDIYPQINLNQNERIETKMQFDSLSEPFIFDFEVKPSDGLDNGEVKVVDVTPIAHENKLILEINIANLTTKPQTITLNLVTPDGNMHWEETLDAFNTHTVSKEMSNYSLGEYILTVDTPTQQYTQYIYPIKSKSQTPIIVINKNKVVQKIVTGDENNGSGTREINIAILIGLAVLTAIALTLIFLLATRKRYI